MSVSELVGSTNAAVSYNEGSSLASIYQILLDFDRSSYVNKNLSPAARMGQILA